MTKKTTAASLRLPTYISTGEAATLLKVSPRTLEGWRRFRSGPPYHLFGRAVRYDKDAVLRWASAHVEREVA